MGYICSCLDFDGCVAVPLWRQKYASRVRFIVELSLAGAWRAFARCGLRRCPSPFADQNRVTRLVTDHTISDPSRRTAVDGHPQSNSGHGGMDSMSRHQRGPASNSKISHSTEKSEGRDVDPSEAKDQTDQARLGPLLVDWRIRGLLHRCLLYSPAKNV
jgi:hypothetical protein